LPANTRRTVPLWANLISDPGEGDSWQIFIANNSLEGAFMEDFLLDWGRGAYDPAFALTQLEKVENWVQSGRKIVLVSQGDRDRGEDVFAREALYAFAASLLVTDGVDVAFKYDNYTDETGEGRSEHYNEYYEYPENLYRLGYPTSGRIGSATNPYVFQRKFQCGVVKVDLVSGRSQVSMTPCYPTITPLPAEEDSTEAAVLTGELTSKTTKNHATADKKK